MCFAIALLLRWSMCVLSVVQVTVAAEARSMLFESFIASMTTATPQTELLYGSAALIQAGGMEAPSLVCHSDTVFQG